MKPPKLAAPPKPGLGTFADALRARGLEVNERAPVTPTPPAGTETDLSRCGKIVVRRERKGHGGKSATVIEGVSFPEKDLERLAQRMRKALGCGAWVEDGRIVLQGDRAPATEAWLRANGAGRVVRGN